MTKKTFFFAGGGTGGHIYPGLAVAEKIKSMAPDCDIYFFISQRQIDKTILDNTSFNYTQLPATGLYLKPADLINFFTNFAKSSKIAKQKLSSSQNPVVIGTGGFVAAPVCRIAYKLKIPVKLINTDLIPGKANRFLARYTESIFTQFEQTSEYLPKYTSRIKVTGCPLRAAFENPDPSAAVKDLQLDPQKKTLLVTGASSGAASINQAVVSLLGFFEKFADNWQIVHLTGSRDYQAVKQKYASAAIEHVVVDYYHHMPDLLSAADLIIGRSGAVSVAEYSAARTPAICMPYPHHKDRHQYFNAEPLVEQGAAIVVDDLPDIAERSGWLEEELLRLLGDGGELAKMKTTCQNLPKNQAAQTITKHLLSC